MMMMLGRFDAEMAGLGIVSPRTIEHKMSNFLFTSPYSTGLGRGGKPKNRRSAARE
jgi:hypothetical protein